MSDLAVALAVLGIAILVASLAGVAVTSVLAVIAAVPVTVAWEWVKA
jgi:hypothetical protein